ncbi:MAG: hypothetical protein GDA45_05215 [Chromatiales bacterium]|nr:hypothetical protein [Chromatiales bacterium]
MRIDMIIDGKKIFKELIKLRESLGIEEGNYNFRRDSILKKLEDDGVEIEADEIKIYYDRHNNRFKYKGETVIVYIIDPHRPADYLLDPKLRRGKKDKYPKFHFRMCQTLIEMLEKGRYDERYILARSRDGLFTVHAREEIGGHSYKLDERVKLYVCRYCLREEDYNGYLENTEQRTNIVENFNLGEFLYNEEARHAL